MKPKDQERVVTGSVVLAYAALIGWALRKVMRQAKLQSTQQKSSKLASVKKWQSEVIVKPLQSVSWTSHGDAPLDRLSHITAVDETNREEDAVFPLAEPTVNRTEDEVLKRQSLDSKLLPGWHLPTPQCLPVPTFAPAIMAMGIVFFVMGIVTTWYVCVAGIIVFAVATWLWLAELQGD